METTVQPSAKELWSGGDSPFRVSYGKVMIWYFLISDTFTFAGLLISYGAIRTSQPKHDPNNPLSWPDPNHVFNAGPGFHNMPLLFVTFMTFTLILSSVTMVRAVQEGHAMNRKGVERWLIFTIIGGLTFVLSQAWEWHHLIVDEHMGLHGNEFGAQAFGALFFLITGFHGTHVSVGVGMNTWALISTHNKVFEKRGHYEMIEKLGLYWHFVDLVWVFVFLAFYLL